MFATRKIAPEEAADLQRIVDGARSTPIDAAIGSKRFQRRSYRWRQRS